MTTNDLPTIGLCPFCKYEKAKLTTKRIGNYRREGDGYQVLCGKCFARGPLFAYRYEEHGHNSAFYKAAALETKLKAIEAWNKAL